MANNNRQPKWDIYESVILLDGYLELQQKKEPRAWVIRRISADLRKMAINRGEKIDDVFRNENGISYQLQSMESAYLGHQIYVPATKLFSDTVSLYREDRESYFKLLCEAKKMITSTVDHKQLFFAWASSSLPASRQKWLETNLRTVELFGNTNRIIFGSIYDVTDLDALFALQQALRKNKIFRVKYRKIYPSILEDLSAFLQYCIETKEGAVKDGNAAPESETTDAEVNHTDQPVQEESTKNPSDIKTIDFLVIPSMAFTKPHCIKYKNVTLPVQSWKDAYVVVVAALFKDYPAQLAGLRSFPGSTRIEFCSEEEAGQLVSPRAISDQLYAETNYSATDIIKRIKMLLDLCGANYDTISIQYRVRRSTDSGVPSCPEGQMKQHLENAFYTYLRDSAKLAEKTCAAYVSAIRSAERFAESHGYSTCALFCENSEITVATVAALNADPDFVRYNEEQHNRFSAAINKLLESIGAKQSGNGDTAQATITSTQGPSVSVPTKEIDRILRTYYQYGFKYESILEMMRFRQYAESMGIVLPETDELLKEAILSSGDVIENKVYCKSNDLAEGLRAIVEEAYLSGAKAIYYSCLLQEKADWMLSHKVTSEEILKEYLRKHITGCAFSKKFMTRGQKRTEKEAVTDEIRRVWGDRPIESVADLSERLPYIPSENIWRVISGNDSFVLDTEGYLLIDRFRITPEEEDEILEYVESSCRERGFASLSDVPLGGIAEENYEISQQAVWNAIYKKVLLGRFHLNGKILTRDKPELDAVALIKHRISGREECSFEEIAKMAEDLTGGPNRQYAFQALYDEMVRVDSNRFVNNRFLSFDIDAIDHILSSFITDHFRAIRDVTTFALFPLCGQPWNHYLLESYCYKYSKKYCLRVLNFNDKNAGIIAENDYNRQYNEMLAIALARSGVDLTESIAGQYLCNSGYTAKSRFSNLENIVQKAIELRKEG